MTMNMNYCSFVLALVLVVSPVLAAVDAGQENNAWYWYNNAVDLANAGKFSEALAANEKALSINESMPIAWANEAGILVQLGRYKEAVTAADKVLSAGSSTEMPNTYAAAWHSKGDALRALGRTAEAQDAYTKAYALDNTLLPPDLSRDTPRSTPLPSTTTVPPMTNPVLVTNTPVSGVPGIPVTTPKSSLPAIGGIAAVVLGTLLCARTRKTPG
jgi:tetratricopeptide (TPR) repeat protein